MARQRYAARVVLLSEADDILLFKWRNPRSGNTWWATPGGGLDPGEKSIDGARRELREETGFEAAELQGPVWDAEHWFRSGADLIHQRERFFLGRCERFEPVLEGLDDLEADALLEARWWALRELETTAERVYPVALAGLVRSLLAKGVPEKPIKLPR